MGIVKALRFPEEVAHLAKRHCIVGRALEVPVHLRRLECRAVSFAAAAAA